jgi:integrase
MKLERVKSGSSWEWRLDVTVAGRRYRETFKSKKKADDFVAEIKVQTRRRRHGLVGDRARIKLEELVDEWIKDLDLKETANNKRAATIIRSFVRVLPAGILLEEIKRAHFREYAKGRRRAALKPESINREFAYLSTMFNSSPTIFPELEEDWRPPLIPWESVSKRGRERIITLAEREVLLEALRFPGLRVDGRRIKPENIQSRRDVADCLELAFHTGMRGGEVRGIEWSEVDFDAREAHLPGHKTKKREPRDVPLNSRALEILRRRFEGANFTFEGRKCKGSALTLHTRGRWVFPNRAGDGPRGEISRVVRPVARRLGLRYGREFEDGFTPHSTRHTATTELLRAGHDLKTVQDIVGHSDKVMSLRYAHSTKESRRTAVESLVKVSRKG